MQSQTPITTRAAIYSEQIALGHALQPKALMETNTWLVLSGILVSSRQHHLSLAAFRRTRPCQWKLYTYTAPRMTIRLVGVGCEVCYHPCYGCNLGRPG